MTETRKRKSSLATLILCVLGALTSAGLGAVWLGDAAEMKESIEQLRAMGMASEIDTVIRGAYALLAAAALGIAGAVLNAKGKSKVAAGLLLLAVVLPLIFTPKSLLGTFLLGIAALLSFKRARGSSSAASGSTSSMARA